MLFVQNVKLSITLMLNYVIIENNSSDEFRNLFVNVLHMYLTSVTYENSSNCPY